MVPLGVARRRDDVRAGRGGVRRRDPRLRARAPTARSTRTCCARRAWSGWVLARRRSTSAPAAVARRGTDVLDLAIRGTDNALYHRYFQPGSGWSAWEALGGNATARPGAQLSGRQTCSTSGIAAPTASSSSARGTGGVARLAATSVAGLLGRTVGRLPRWRSTSTSSPAGPTAAPYQRYWTRASGWSGWAQARSDADRLDAGGGLGPARPRRALRPARGGVVVKEWTRHRRLDAAGPTGARRAAAAARTAGAAPRRTGACRSGPASAARRPAGG